MIKKQQKQHEARTDARNGRKRKKNCRGKRKIGGKKVEKQEEKKRNWWFVFSVHERCRERKGQTRERNLKENILKLGLVL